MIKKIDIAGVQLDNYTVRESLMKIECSMEEHAYYTVEEITMEQLLLADKDERVKSALEKLDLSIIAETEILDAVGQKVLQRQHEIENGVFFYELIKHFERKGNSVFLLGETENITQEFADCLVEEFPRLSIIGMQAMENCEGEVDMIINEMNANSPEVVVSILPSPSQEYFILEQRDKISANLWYGMGAHMPTAKKRNVIEHIRRWARARKLEKHISDYEGQEEQEL